MKSPTKTAKSSVKTNAKTIMMQQIAEVLRLRESARSMMKEASAIEAGLLDLMAVDQPYTLPSGQIVTVTDNFSAKNEVWKASCYRRFELKVIG